MSRQSRYSLLFIVFSTFISSHLFAQAISGVVVHNSSPVQAARVRVQATEIFTTTGADGLYILQNVPAADSLVVTAWAEGYYNGQSMAVPGDTGVVIELHPLFTEDNADYQWIAPDADSSEALRCGNCHTSTLMNQWRSNAHGQSAVNPFFLAMYYGTDIDGNPNKGVGYKLDFPNTMGNCATCHIPGAAANDPWGVDPQSVDEVNKNGVFCDVCHKIYNVDLSSGQGTTGTLSIHFLRPPEGTQIFFGPFDDIHEPDAYLPLIRQSEFCAPCHTGRFWNVPAYQSFPEWQASDYADQGIECQTCHMFPDSVTTHFANPAAGGLERNPLTIPSHLQPGSRDPVILANSVTMNLSVLQNGDMIDVTVTVRNDKTGHHVPTGRPSRNMILLTSAMDDRSNSLEFIGEEKVPWWGGQGDPADGFYSDLPGKGFAKILEDFEGNAPSPAWRPNFIQSDNRIAAFETDTSTYQFRVSEETASVTVKATLLFRRFFKSWMDEKNFDIPDIVMEEDSVSVTLSSVEQDMNPAQVPREYLLGQNYPNPFNPLTTIPFYVPERSRIVIQVYNARGNEVATLSKNHYESGWHTVVFDADRLTTGVYMIVMRYQDKVYRRKALLLK